MALCSYLPGWDLLVFPCLPWADWLQHLVLSAEPRAQPHRHWDLPGSAAEMHSPHAALGGHFLALQVPVRIWGMLNYKTITELFKHLQIIISNLITVNQMLASLAQKVFISNIMKPQAGPGWKVNVIRNIIWLNVIRKINMLPTCFPKCNILNVPAQVKKERKEKRKKKRGQ